MNKEILDLNEANLFHLDEIVYILDQGTIQEDDKVLLNDIIDPLTYTNHMRMLVWIMEQHLNNSTTSYQIYLDKCKELSIPHYTNE